MQEAMVLSYDGQLVTPRLRTQVKRLKMSKIKFHFDEHMDKATANGLRRRGIDVTTTFDVGLLEASDPDQIEFATREGRVLVTCDRKIGVYVQGQSKHSGIVILRPGRNMIGPNVNLLSQLCRDSSAEEMVDEIRYLKPAK
jgi:predicted nuclease of predicted toxin-antitoxin system